MKASQFFQPTKKDVDKSLIVSHQHMLRMGMIANIGKGLYAYLPLGFRILEKIENIVAMYHNRFFNRCVLPVLQPAEYWHSSGRYHAYGSETLRIFDRNKRELIYGPSAEEVMSHCITLNNHLSQKILPINLYNIQYKFRDEIRPRFGVLRSREFLMSDAYSYHSTYDEMVIFYNDVKQMYVEMFAHMGLKAYPVEQKDTGEIGGELSHEFAIIAPHGESSVVDNEQEYSAIEVGHIFALGSVYSEKMNITIDGHDDKRYVYMGCYGVGISRLVGALVDVFLENTANANKMQLLLPKNVSTFTYGLISLNQNEVCDYIYSQLHCTDNVYYDDRIYINSGEKINNAYSIGLTYIILVGAKEIKEDIYTIKDKKSNCSSYTKNELINYINNDLKAK